MRLARKLQKIASGDLLKSAWEHAVRWTHPVNAQAMLRRLDPAAIARLQRAYPASPDPQVHNSSKFTDAPYWIKTNVERAQDLWLDSTAPLRVLDLGCGPGYFLYVCRCLGHDGLGLDIDEMPLFQETTAMLGVRREICRIKPMTPLPDLGGAFDLVTSHCVCFQKLARVADGKWSQWGPAEWEFFLNDVRTRILKPTGRLLLDFNPQADGLPYPKAVGDCFRANGARIFRSKALFAANGARPVWAAPSLPRETGLAVR